MRMRYRAAAIGGHGGWQPWPRASASDSAALAGALQPIVNGSRQGCLVQLDAAAGPLRLQVWCLLCW